MIFKPDNLKIKRISFILFLIAVCRLTNLTAQDLNLFYLRYYEKDSTQSVAFVSLSEVHALSDHPDSLAIPDLREKEMEEAPKFTCFKLDSTYRKRFLSAAKISETDKVFIYDYSIDALQSFTVKNLSVVACLNIYGADWPYSQYDYMIGFEIDPNIRFGKYFTNTLVYVGKKNPFVQGQIKPIVWEKMESNVFPPIAISPKDTSELKRWIAGKVYKKGNAYKYETSDFLYFVQDFLRDDIFFARRWLVIEFKTKKTVCNRIYYNHEGAINAPLNLVETEGDIIQWTGRLFKKRPPVVFGLEYVSFGCPGIIFLNQSERDIFINCDNRH